MKLLDEVTSSTLVIPGSSTGSVWSQVQSLETNNEQEVYDGSRIPTG
jgi:hypothetical protein